MMFRLPQTEAQAVTFLQNCGVLHRSRQCEKGHPMSLKAGSGRRRWRCATCEQQSSLRVGTWLEKTKLPLVTVVRFLYCWSTCEFKSVSACAKELDVTCSSVLSWSHALREICLQQLLDQPVAKIGGPNEMVEVDESMFKERKNHVGRILPQTHILGGLCRAKKQWFVVRFVDEYSASALLQAIIANVKPGSTIITDCLRAFSSEELWDAGFEQVKADYGLDFVDPSANVRVQDIGRLWGSERWRNKRQKKTGRAHLDSYLVEFLWRQHLGGRNAFESIVRAVADDALSVFRERSQLSPAIAIGRIQYFAELWNSGNSELGMAEEAPLKTKTSNLERSVQIYNVRAAPQLSLHRAKMVPIILIESSE